MASPDLSVEISIVSRGGCDNIRRDLVFVIDLLPPLEDVDEAQWTCEWLKNSDPHIETQIFKGIDNNWPTESDLSECLGVVMTGSSCSCVNDYPHTEPLFRFFETILRLDIPPLTICYSAQMLVRWLAGRENVIRLPEPHIGFVRNEFLAKHDINDAYSLLNDITDGFVIFSSAQSDAFCLPDQSAEFSVRVGSTMKKTRFHHIAAAAQCPYQAFQLTDLPVWGVQFHPNWPVEGAETVFRRLKLDKPHVNIARHGDIDENKRRALACRFLTICRHHMATRRIRNHTELTSN